MYENDGCVIRQNYFLAVLEVYNKIMLKLSLRKNLDHGIWRHFIKRCERILVEFLKKSFKNSFTGIFIFHKGLAKLHIMPDFPSSGCFQSEEEVNISVLFE